MGNLSEEYEKFKEDAHQYLKSIHKDLKALISGSGEVRNSMFVKEETLIIADFRSLT